MNNITTKINAEQELQLLEQQQFSHQPEDTNAIGEKNHMRPHTNVTHPIKQQSASMITTQQFNGPSAYHYHTNQVAPPLPKINIPHSHASFVMKPKTMYRNLKKNFKYLVYENEYYQEELRNLQRKLLKLSRDKNFLLDRLHGYEVVSASSDDSDSSMKTVDGQPQKTRRRQNLSNRGCIINSTRKRTPAHLGSNLTDKQQNDVSYIRPSNTAKVNTLFDNMPISTGQSSERKTNVDERNNTISSFTPMSDKPPSTNRYKLGESDKMDATSATNFAFTHSSIATEKYKMNTKMSAVVVSCAAPAASSSCITNTVQ